MATANKFLRRNVPGPVLSIYDPEANDTPVALHNKFELEDSSRSSADDTYVDDTSVPFRREPEHVDPLQWHADDIAERLPRHDDGASASFRDKQELEHSSRQHADDMSASFHCEHVRRRRGLWIESARRADSLTRPLYNSHQLAEQYRPRR